MASAGARARVKSPTIKFQFPTSNLQTFNHSALEVGAGRLGFPRPSLLDFPGLDLETKPFLRVRVLNTQSNTVLVVLGADELHQVRARRQDSGCEFQLNRAGERAGVIQREVIRQGSIAGSCPALDGVH